MDSITSSGDPNVAPMGEHVGDWEMCMIRVNNTTLNLDGIWLSQHAKGQFFTADQIDRAFNFQGTQPIVFSARNGHGNWPQAGSNPTESRRLEAYLAAFNSSSATTLLSATSSSTAPKSTSLFRQILSGSSLQPGSPIPSGGVQREPQLTSLQGPLLRSFKQLLVTN